MELEWAPLNEPAAQQTWRTVLRPLATELREAAAGLSEQLAAAIVGDLPHLFPDPASLEENRISAEANILVLAHLIERGGDPRKVELPTATIAIVRHGVWHQLPLADLLRTYRLGHELAWRWLFARIAASAPAAEGLVAAEELASAWLFAFIDTAVTQAATMYDVERETWMRSAMAARGEAIDDIVAGRETDQVRAGARLRHDVRRHHLGVTAWLDGAPAEDDAQTVLARAVAQLAAAVGVQQPLIYPSGVLACSAWLSRSTRWAEADLAALKDVAPASVHVAIGEPGSGLAGFRRTFLEAAQARRIGALGPADARATRYADVALVALGTRDAEMAADFVVRVLGRLAAPDETTRRLAETLAVFLEENRSRKRAAARLHVHPNTVNYRVRQAEEVLGASVDGASLDLRAALALLPVVPPPPPS